MGNVVSRNLIATGTPVTPAAITKHVVKLARQLSQSSTPVFVKIELVEPIESFTPEACFRKVAALVKSEGGALQHGWLIREQAGVFVEAEFHAVWKRPDGVLVGIVPMQNGELEVLFLPDARRKWDGDIVEHRRMLLHEKPCYCGSGMPFHICHGLADD